MAERIDIRTDPDAASAKACALLAAGEVIGLPTETVYGLAADATRAEAITRIYETKGRPRFNPLICHMSELEMAERHVVFDPLSRRLAEAFWPGPLTLVLPKRTQSGIHDLATSGLDTVGVRVPAGFAARLIADYGHPLAAPSANSSGKISATNARHVEADLGDRIKLILDAGAAVIGVESTILKVEPDGVLRLLRPGGLAVSDIEAVADQAVLRGSRAGPAIEAPGMLASHYAPGAAVRLEATRVMAGEALIRFGRPAVANEDQAALVLDLSPGGNLAEAAANLFAAMKQADATGVRAIAFSPIPHEGLGEAINDRLQRAAAPRE